MRVGWYEVSPRRPLALAAVVASLVGPSLAFAATLTVTSPADDLDEGPNGNCTLREAVVAANTDAPVDACPAGAGPDRIELPAGSFVLAIAGKHRTLGGQLWGIIGLSVPCVPILLAGDIPVGLTMEAWGTWLIGFGATTLAVRGVIASQKRQSRAIHWGVIAGLSIAVAALTWAGFQIPIVTLPMISMSWYLLYAPPPAKQLKRVGWTLVGGTFATACWMAIMV